MNIPKQNRESNPKHTAKDIEDTMQEQMAGLAELAEVAKAAGRAVVKHASRQQEVMQDPMQQEASQSLFFIKDIGEISAKLDGVYEEYRKLRERFKTLGKDNEEMKMKIDTQGETIRTLESSLEKLQEELETVKKEKDQLRIKIEEKISKSSKENKILTEKLDALTKVLEAVENENKDLKRSLKEQTNSNDALKETVEKLKETVHVFSMDNQKLKDDMSNLEAEHKSIKKKLECKETRLALGQVAWILEKEISKVVLPHVDMGVTRILNNMERWLKKNSSNEEGKAAQKRWEELKIKLLWDEEDHISALKNLKKLRLEDAHPKDVDLEVARKQLKEGNYVPESEKKSCEELIDMITTARKLNTKK